MDSDDEDVKEKMRIGKKAIAKMELRISSDSESSLFDGGDTSDHHECKLQMDQ